MKCSKCGNELKKEYNNYTTIKKDKIVNLGVTKKWYCSNCGEIYFDIEQSKKVDKKLKEI